MDNTTQRYLNIRRATLIGAFVDILLGILKIGFGLSGHSQALITDGVHSLSDLFTDFMVILAAKWGSLKPDFEHPYGHGRIETLGTLLMAMIIIAVGLGFGYDALKDIVLPRPFASPNASVLVIAIISIISKEWLYHYTLKTTGSISFDLAHSNAWHHRSDALSSGIVLIGIIGAMIGFKHADSIAALLVSLFIAKIGFQMIWNSLRELIDTGVDSSTLDKVTRCIEKTPGVLSIHQLRTRSMGSRIFVDVHLLVDPFISVSEGHYIGDQVCMNLKQEMPQIEDVTVHIDHENDEVFMISSQLPNRAEIEKQLAEPLRNSPLYAVVENIQLHYLAGKVSIELMIRIDEENIKNAVQLTAQFEKSIQQISYIDKIKILYCVR